MKKISKYVAAFTLATAVTVSAPLGTYSSTAHANSTATQTKPAPKAQNQATPGSENTMAVSWYQNSAEAKALYLQGYNSAKVQLDKELKKHKGKGQKKLAIALDLDETVLDNSPYQGYATLYNKSHPEGWHEWVESAQAKPVYGAKEFLKYADKKGVDIYYITDRDYPQDFEGTQQNLKNLGIPQATKDHLMLKSKNDKSKESRREKVRKNHNLVMLFGDNLLDFDDPKSPSQPDREKLVQRHKDDFGKKYIIFPNPMYGSWESSVYGNKNDLSDEQKQQLRKESIHYFDPQSQKIRQQ
ncbi:5'-nucleotidase, lipoprotein e(P4) family [Staphylococcus durrellii]|uniref:5'-nucleotidase, lipoprotein e(P4) family n=1 Tax=Staphylococcus durrellii TaxID=2781773 RepID=UPI00189CB810|nr:5'-nucleotidase, lipoprotein e(P4) family [Staphylococcus durrellii]MBF7015998.1 5'-nucleotidase, lipoprotein e(P4) family [Staphylococcus durrellii]